MSLKGLKQHELDRIHARSNRPRSQGACTKVRFRSRAKANQFEHTHRDQYGRQFVYYCVLCDCFHLTSKDPKTYTRPPP